MDESGHECKILVGKRFAKCPIERPKRKWQDNIKMAYSEI
jgi:hypothetical protein